MRFLKEGDEIIVPSDKYIATILAISAYNLTPILLEPDSKTFNINLVKIEQAISTKSKIIIQYIFMVKLLT